MNNVSRADAARVAMLVRGLVAIGRPMPMPARAFYVAWLYRFPQFFGFDLLAELARAIGVLDLPPEAIMFVEWGNASSDENPAKRLLIEEELSTAGVWDSALAALDAGIAALRLMNENASVMTGFDSEPRSDGDA